MKKISGVGLCIAMLGGCSQTPTTDLNGLSYKDLKAEYLRRKMKRKEIQQYYVIGTILGTIVGMYFGRI